MLRRSLELRQQLRDSIRSDIAERTAVHQLAVDAWRARLQLDSLLNASQAAPLVMLAHGDSWFDYPLNGNDLSRSDTDVIAHLRSMGGPSPLIQNVSHYGDATTAEMSLPKQERMIESLRDRANWLNQGRPDAILFSGGGNDIAGNQFCIFLNDAAPAVPGLNAERFHGVLDMVDASYRDLFAFRDKYSPGTPVFGHCYDFPIPNGIHPDCAGPWLKPSLDFAGWDPDQGQAILHQALTNFREMLQRLAADAANNFQLVGTQGTLESADWANELHPHPDGFGKIATKFLLALRERFPGRI